ncbi:MAG: CotH kinase family protein [Muribaculaceae bacterium]|nr:CotH kinase family protein [Muribaculaceae bacterium]
MKRLLLLLAVMVMAILTQAADLSSVNYPPDRINVKLEQTNLPIVWMEVDGARIDLHERITARMKIIDNGDGRLNYADTVAHPGQRIDYEGYIALRYRGNSSFSTSAKKPYSFRPLDKPLEDGGEKVKVKIMGMSKDNNWALLAPYSDKSMIRDLLTFELSRPWMDYVPTGRFCELFLDGIYYGVYIMTEVVSKGKRRLNLEDPGTAGDAVTGDYLVEVDRDDEVHYTSKYHPVDNAGNEFTDRYVYYQYKSPDYEEMTPEQIDYINNRIDLMEDVFHSDDYKDHETGYHQYIDPLSFVDFQLAQEFGHNVDAYRLSAKMYKRRDSMDGRFRMVLWDFNLAFGNTKYDNGWCTDSWMWQNNDVFYSRNGYNFVPFWWQKLNQDSEYTDLLKERWSEYRNNNFRIDRIMAKIDSMVNVLTVQGAEARNSKAWPRWGKYVWPNKYIAKDYKDEISYMKDWIVQRLAWMDKELEFTLLPGDINGDGLVDVGDVNVIINIILELNDALSYPGKSDLNDDGKVDISDVGEIINIIFLS